jgi:hypothetical protein
LRSAGNISASRRAGGNDFNIGEEFRDAYPITMAFFAEKSLRHPFPLPTIAVVKAVDKPE